MEQRRQLLPWTKSNRSRRADYILTLKRNQENLYEDVKFCFDDEEKKNLRNIENYKKTQEKAHSQIEIQEYYQNDSIKWLNQRNEWAGIKSIGMEEKTMISAEGERKEYLSSSAS